MVLTSSTIKLNSGSPLLVEANLNTIVITATQSKGPTLRQKPKEVKEAYAVPCLVGRSCPCTPGEPTNSNEYAGIAVP